MRYPKIILPFTTGTARYKIHRSSISSDSRAEICIAAIDSWSKVLHDEFPEITRRSIGIGRRKRLYYFGMCNFYYCSFCSMSVFACRTCRADNKKRQHSDESSSEKERAFRGNKSHSDF